MMSGYFHYPGEWLTSVSLLAPLLKLLLRQKQFVCHGSCLSYRLMINRKGTSVVSNLNPNKPVYAENLHPLPLGFVVFSIFCCTIVFYSEKNWTLSQQFMPNSWQLQLIDGWLEKEQKHSSYLVVQPCMWVLVNHRSSDKNLWILRQSCPNSVMQIWLSIRPTLSSRNYVHIQQNLQQKQAKDGNA